MNRIVWRLRGSTDKIVECCLEHTTYNLHAVTVVLGRETFLEEAYPDVRSATERAASVRDRLLASGGWTVIAEAAVGLSSR